MCGILGGNNKTWNYKNALQVMYHRGPDAQKKCDFYDFTLAFTRLSVMDLSDYGMQPMTHGEVSIVFNGEIYGFSVLKNELQKKYRFQSHSDTEVILYSYIEYGDAFIDKIDGMFAIAIYDGRQHKVKLYRDRSGIKPLYYYYNGKDFLFASELKALKECLGERLSQIDYSAIYDYLFYQYIPEPKTMYKNCYKLPPAHSLVFDLDTAQISLHKYWKLKVNTRESSRIDLNEAAYKLKTLVEKSVKEQMIADVSVGVFLSGGIDSSVISYECSRINPNIKTFTMGFDESKYNEKPYADILIEKYNLNSYSQIMDSGRFVSQRKKIVNWYDEPFADTSAYPSYMVSKMAKQEVTVVLTGDGGDELFGGYDRYREYSKIYENKKSELPFLSSLIQQMHFKSLINNDWYHTYISDGLEEYTQFMFLSDDEAAEELKKKWRLGRDYDPKWFLKKYYINNLPPITRARYLDFKTYLPGDVLTKVDRVSMANSLETRVPFLSRNIIEFVFSLPQNVVCEGDNLKKIMKQAYKGLIPDEILYRKKKGFSVPRSFLRSVRHSVPVTIDLLSEWNIYR